MSARAAGRRPRVVTPAAALAVGILVLVMLASVAVISSVAHQTWLSNFGQVAIWLSFGLVGVVVAWHQPRNPMGWVLLGITFFFTLDGVAGEYAYFDYHLHGGRLPVGWLAVLLALSWAPAIVLAGLAFALPVSIGFGILKFRLYDIDRIISRTLAYAIVTGALVGMYAGLVLLATEVFRFRTPVAVAAATLAAAALFNPLRHRVQHAVDRRFNRARYDADQMVAAFAARLQDAVELGAIRADLLEVVDGALEPTHVSLWTGPGS